MLPVHESSALLHTDAGITRGPRPPGEQCLLPLVNERQSGQGRGVSALKDRDGRTFGRWWRISTLTL
jgi:hypothetical protein